MSYRYGYEEIDYVDGTNDWVWNAPQHVFFLRLRELFDAELCELYTTLESLGCWSATSLINQFNDWQAQFPEELWRLDIERKYIRTYTSSYINDVARPEYLKERANGRKKMQRAQFEKNQEKYMASKFSGNVAAADDIILRCSVPNTTLAVPANFDMHLTPYSYVYLNVKYNTSPPIKVRAVPNTEYTIKYDAELADIIEIYSASCMKSIGDLSACYLINADFGNATKIRELTLGNSTPGYDNSNSMTLGLGSNGLLNRLNIENMSGLTHSLDLSGLKNLEELYAFGSNVSGVIFADGGNISAAEIPAVGSLQMKNLSYLLDEGFDIVSYNNLSRLVAEYSNLDLISLINNATNLYQVRLTGIDWTLENTSLLERMYGLAGITNTGSNADRSVLAGKVFVPVIRQQQLYDYQRAWPDLDITFNTLIEQYPVTFINDDGTVLEVQYVDKGEDAVDPITRENNPIPIPTKESTASTEYTYAGWDSILTDIFSERTIKATYTESTRSYTIKYVSKGTTLQTSTGLYGENVIYEGDIPTYTLEEGGYKYYLFDRWDNSGFIDGDKTINAIFDSMEYTENYFANKEITDMTPVEIYALTKLGLDNVNHIIEEGDDFSFEMGYDIDFDDIESEVVISEKTSFDGETPINTDTKLFDEDKDFVIAIDYKMSSNNSVAPGESVDLVGCYHDGNRHGFRLSYDGGVKFNWCGKEINSASVDCREMVVLRHTKGSPTVTVYVSNIESTTIGVTELTAAQNFVEDSTLVFGCRKMPDGKYEKYAVGDIYWCKIWYADLGDKACKELVSWTHEKINLEVCSFKKYYLSENSSKRCSFTLLASQLLDRNKHYNDSGTNSGGWAKSSLNTFLNTRFYEAIPVQIKSLIKQVSVASTVGDKSSDISNSACYVFIPSITEVSSQYTQAPYSSEGTTISYMTSNDARKRMYSNGTYGNYWTRSPNIDYNYVWSIGQYENHNGDPNGFVMPNNDGIGVLIQISF